MQRLYKLEAPTAHAWTFARVCVQAVEFAAKLMHFVPQLDSIQATGERQCPQFPVMSRESALTRSQRHRNSCSRRPTKIHRYLCHPMSPWAGFILTIPISSFLASHRGAEYRWLTRERRRHSGTCNFAGNFYGTDLQRT